MHVLYEKLAIVDEYLVHHCCREVSCCQNLYGMRPIVIHKRCPTAHL